MALLKLVAIIALLWREQLGKCANGEHLCVPIRHFSLIGARRWPLEACRSAPLTSICPNSADFPVQERFLGSAKAIASFSLSLSGALNCWLAIFEEPHH